MTEPDPTISILIPKPVCSPEVDHGIWRHSDTATFTPESLQDPLVAENKSPFFHRKNNSQGGNASGLNGRVELSVPEDAAEAAYAILMDSGFSSSWKCARLRSLDTTWYTILEAGLKRVSNSS